MILSIAEFLNRCNLAQTHSFPRIQRRCKGRGGLATLKLIWTKVILLQGRKVLANSITAAVISFASQILVELPLEMRTNAVALSLIYPNVLGINSDHRYSHSALKVDGYVTITNTKRGGLEEQINTHERGPNSVLYALKKALRHDYYE